jgi:hypothetical protein
MGNRWNPRRPAHSPLEGSLTEASPIRGRPPRAFRLGSDAPRTGQGCAVLTLCAARPSLFLHAETFPQPSAGARRCRARLLLHDRLGEQRSRRSAAVHAGGRPRQSAEAEAATVETPEAQAHAGRASGQDRATRGGRPVPLGRNVAEQRLRLLGTRLLGLRTAGRARTRWPASAGASAGRI